MKFEEISLDPAILAGIAAAGFEECTTVQSLTIPRVLQGSDVAVQSQTGTGKTAAFLIPIFQLLLHDERFSAARALVVAPTRELAVQIKEESDLLAEDLPLTTTVLYGGVGYQQQQRELAEGARIIVGTPGRLIDMAQSGHLPMKEVGILVIDEADRLFDMGFYPDIRRMMRMLRPRAERINMLFSATLSVKARNIAWEHMNDPAEIEVEPEHITVSAIKQSLYHVSTDEKMRLMLGLFARKRPRNAIVFTNTKRMAEEVAKRLEINGYPAEFIIGDLPQRKRSAIINRIKKGEAEFLVATDVAARGLHINNLELVINYDIPEDSEAYVHRIGRTARAGESGEAISFACEHFVFGLEAIEKLLGRPIPAVTLTDDLIGEDKSAGQRIFIESGRGERDGGHADRRGGTRGGTRAPTRGARPSGSRQERRERADDRVAASLTRADGDRESGRSRHRVGPDAARGGEVRHAVRGAEGRHGADSRHSGAARGGEVRTGDSRRRSPAAEAPNRSASLEERLSYYRSKYGEDFRPTDEMLASFNDSSTRAHGPGPGGSQGSGDGPPKKRRRRKKNPSAAAGNGHAQPSKPEMPPSTVARLASHPTDASAGQAERPSLWRRIRSLFRPV